MYKFIGDPNLVIFEHKTNRKLVTFNSLGEFETSDQYVIQKLIKAGYKYEVIASDSTDASKDEEISKLSLEKEELLKEIEDLKAKLEEKPTVDENGENHFDGEPQEPIDGANAETSNPDSESGTPEVETAQGDSIVPKDDKPLESASTVEITNASKKESKKTKDIE